MIGSAKLLLFWDVKSWWPPFTFYGLSPWVLLVINMLWVDVSCGVYTFFFFLRGKPLALECLRRW
jgi:hypothetical protein